MESEGNFDYMGAEAGYASLEPRWVMSAAELGSGWARTMQSKAMGFGRMGVGRVWLGVRILGGETVNIGGW
jgi:hypothetical protein